MQKLGKLVEKHLFNRISGHKSINLIGYNFNKDIQGGKLLTINNFYPKYKMSNSQKDIKQVEPVANEESKEQKQEQSGEDAPKEGPSKNELKRQQKLKEQEEKKKQKEEEKKKKEAEEAAKGPKKEKKVAEEEIIDPVLYYESRSKIIQNLKKDASKYPYPHKFEVSHQHKQFHDEFNPLCTENAKFLEDRVVSIAGIL